VNTTFLAGSAKVDITPPLTIPYLGYEPRHALFQGVHDPLYARAVALSVGDCAVLLIAADAIGFSNAILGPDRNFTAEVRHRIARQTGVPAANIVLTASHAHSTPETAHLRRLLDTPAAAPWLEVLIDQLVSAAIMAWSQRQPSRLKAATGSVVGLARNRRVIGRDGRILSGPEYTPEASETIPQPVDPTVSVLYLESLDGSGCTVLANFACHPVTVQVQPLVSADFPGVAMSLVEQIVPGCRTALFLQGACGNLNPVRNTTDFADVERYGLMLGSEVVKLAARLSAPDQPALSPHLAVAATTLALPVRDLPPQSSSQAAYDEATARLTSAKSDEERRHWGRQQRMAEEALILIAQGDEPIQAEVQVIRLGECALVALPGEPFVELGLALKARSPAGQTLVVGYTNDWIGYLTTPEAWTQGGYEVAPGPWTRVGPQGGSQVVEAALALLAQLWSA
jgi:neutral ceramidase